MAKSIQEHFRELPDPRRSQGRRHRLSDMVVIAVCAVVRAADSWPDVVDFGNAKLKWSSRSPTGSAARAASRCGTPPSS